MPSSSFLPNASNSSSSTEQDERAAANRDTPAPDDERKPDSPTEVQKPAWKYVLKRPSGNTPGTNARTLRRH